MCSTRIPRRGLSGVKAESPLKSIQIIPCGFFSLVWPSFAVRVAPLGGKKMYKLHVVIYVTSKKKSIRTALGDRSDTKGIDLRATIKKLTVSAVFGWVMRSLISLIFGGDDV